MEVVILLSVLGTAWAICITWSERTKVASRERIEMAQLLDKQTRDDTAARLKALEKTIAEHEFSIGKLHNQLDLVRAQSTKSARPITGLRS